MKQFVSVDLSFLSTTDQVLCRQDHITVSFADEAGKEFHHLSYPWAQRKKNRSADRQTEFTLEYRTI